MAAVEWCEGADSDSKAMTEAVGLSDCDMVARGADTKNS